MNINYDDIPGEERHYQTIKDVAGVNYEQIHTILLFYLNALFSDKLAQIEYEVSADVWTLTRIKNAKRRLIIELEDEW